MFSKQGIVLIHYGEFILGCLSIHSVRSAVLPLPSPNVDAHINNTDPVPIVITSLPKLSSLKDTSENVSTPVTTGTSSPTSTSTSTIISPNHNTKTASVTSKVPSTASTGPTSSSSRITSTTSSPSPSTSSSTSTTSSLSPSTSSSTSTTSSPSPSTPSAPSTSTTAVPTHSSTVVPIKSSSVPTTSLESSPPSGTTSGNSTAVSSTSTMTMRSFTSSNGTSPTSSQTSSASSVTSQPTTMIVTQTTRLVTTESFESKTGLSPGMAFGIFLIALTTLVVLGLALFYYIKKYRRKSYIPCHVKCCMCCTDVHRRRSSTSSGGPLTSQEVTPTDLPEPRQERELFSIGDLDGGDDGRPHPRQRRGTEDDYFYDEIFERSAFVDERTNRSNKRLTVEDEDGDEDDELHIPDLVFKTPSSNI